MISGNLQKQALERLVEAGIDRDDARFDIDLLADILEMNGETSFCEAVERRATGEPVAYILGKQSFYMEEYVVVPGVLIPRSDTEILVEAALRYMGAVDFPMGDIGKVTPGEKKDDFRVADLCTGTGCVGISIFNGIKRQNLHCHMVLGDVSPIAIGCATNNISIAADGEEIAVREFDVLNSDYRELYSDEVDLIVSNPPYITNEEMEELPRDVKEFEPDLALRAGDDGLIFYHELAKRSYKVLVVGGALMVEHGYLQGSSVRKIFEDNGYSDVLTLKDYGGNDRVTIGRKK